MISNYTGAVEGGMGGGGSLWKEGPEPHNWCTKGLGLCPPTGFPSSWAHPTGFTFFFGGGGVEVTEVSHNYGAKKRMVSSVYKNKYFIYS